MSNVRAHAAPPSHCIERAGYVLEALVQVGPSLAARSPCSLVSLCSPTPLRPSHSPLRFASGVGGSSAEAHNENRY